MHPYADLSVAPPSTADRIYDHIRDEILQGKHAPGAPLRQDDIASRFGSSKIPLREAFSRLESEGLLVLRPRRGYSVTALDLDEIEEIFELRALVEAHAARISSRIHGPEEAHRVSRLAADMAALDAAAPDYHDRWCQLNREFHSAIIQASGKRHVIRTATQLRDVIEPYIRLDTSMSHTDGTPDHEHQQIAAAFAGRNENLVAALSAAHCYNTRDRLLASLRGRMTD